MDQFTVPQFLEREAKIFGPITVRQFLICLVGAGLGFLAYKLSDFELFIFEAVIIALVFGTFAFVPYNGRPFHYFILALIGVSKRPRVRVWKKEIKTAKPKIASRRDQTAKQRLQAETLVRQTQINQALTKKRLVKSRLSKLSLTVDTAGRYQENSNKK